MDETFGHYRIVEELGRGGMGVVYKAYEESLNRYVALKVLGEHLTQDSSFVARFVREAQSAASLHHPNVVQIFFIGEERGRHYFAMEWVEGRSLRDVIGERGRLPSEEAVDLLMQAASGLGAAHDRGVLHRDIKPANMMITGDGRLKIADFGLALPMDVATRLTASGALLGTPAYVSPEQCEGLQPDRRSDIYSLGLSFYEMLTGRVPFQADSPMGLLRQILQTEPPPIRELNPDVDPRLEAILERMMAKDREQRYGSCREIIADLEAYRRGEEPEARPAVPLPPPARAAVDDEPVTEQATIVLAEESALVPRGENLPAAPPVERSGKRAALVAAVVVVLLLASVAAAAVFVVGRQWSAARGDGEPESFFSQVADLAERTFGGDGAADDGPPAGSARASTDSPEPPSGPASEGAFSGEPPPTEPSEGRPSSGGGAGSLVAVLEDDRREPRQTLEAEQPENPRRGVSAPTPAPPTIAAKVVDGGRSGARERPATATVEPPPPPPPPPLPARPRVSVVGSGEPLLAVAAEEWLQDELEQRGVDIVAEDSVPALSDLVREPLRVQDLLQALEHNGIHVLVLAEADFVGERPLRYLGRSDRALTSRLRVNVFLTGQERALWPGWSGEIEYTEISARRQTESNLLPAIADLVDRLDEGWEAERRRR